MSSESVVAAFFAAWRVQDLESALLHVHPDVVYALHNGVDASPFAGVRRGREDCRDLGYAVLAEFDYLTYEPTIVSVEGDLVRARVHFRYRHRATGSLIEGTRRLVFQVKDSLIIRLDTYEDTRRLEAFMRLIRQSPKGGDTVNLSLNDLTSGAGA